jgi:hypothetical protein
MEYHFEDLSVDIDGKLGLLIAGTACLERDRHGQFWIDTISVEGPGGNVRLSRSGSQFNIELFRAVEAAIYDSEHARDVWAAHVEEEKRDAA